jgi:hypothetical protein
MSSENWGKYLITKNPDALPYQISHLSPDIVDMLDEAQTTYIEAGIPCSHINHEVLAQQNPGWFGEIVFVNKLLGLYDLQQIQGQDKAEDHLDHLYYCAIFAGSTLDQYAPDHQYVSKEVAQQLYRGRAVAITEAQVVLLEYVQWLYYALLTSYYHVLTPELIAEWEATAQTVFELATEHNDSTMEGLSLKQLDTIEQLLSVRSVRDTAVRKPTIDRPRGEVTYLLHRKLLAFGNFVINTRQVDSDNPIFIPSILA